ncbi:hypothetical protein N802_06005 [Knoellia sinensis KCTC 19936]|uniref:ESX-1 secretion-associated protein n=1 Tax=Knoellia sinensis KCTC 19936 TaxID=1385520 RepID=A0A0A0J0Y1_9MICO|nr:hypothetical protein [Knoellia sinensis]KGN30758.1 hypothetical protein N802_06005 [Knoellia sinensis KCTC 19936]
MADVDVDLNVLADIAKGLDDGAKGLEDLSGSVPAGIDAGPMTAVVAAMLSQIVTSAGNVSTSSTAAADLVRESRRYYARDDAEASATLEEINKIMKPKP